MMKTKHWRQVKLTPLHGRVYHKNGVNDILVVYGNKIKLYKNIQNKGSQDFVPCFAEFTLIRKRKI